MRARTFLAPRVQPVLVAVLASFCLLGSSPGICRACVNDVECNDSNPCTEDACILSICVHTIVPGCRSCTGDADCNDADPFTVDLCVDGVCVHGADCNENGVLDSDDIATGTSADCNDNDIPDECDIASGTSGDLNGNGIPDECEVVDAYVKLDIKPGSCPNPLARASRGVLPVALVGTQSFDVFDVDVDSLRLSRADGVGGSVAPADGPPGPQARVEDVATPFDGEPCDCDELGGDGLDDLLLKFSNRDLVDVLELNDLIAGAFVQLCLSGTLLDGTTFAVCDCIRLAGSE